MSDQSFMQSRAREAFEAAAKASLGNEAISFLTANESVPVRPNLSNADTGNAVSNAYQKAVIAAFGNSGASTFLSGSDAGKGADATPGKNPERSMLGIAGHQLGLAARMGVNAIASIPAMAADAVAMPINAGLDLVRGRGNGFRFKPQMEALGDAMTAAGVATPDNAVERVVQDVGSAIGGAGAAIGGGRLLANGGRELVKDLGGRLGEVLSAAPKLQISSSATGAASSGAMRELGGNDVAQFGAGIVGSMAPVGLSTIRAAGPSANRQLIDIAVKASDHGYVLPPADVSSSLTTQAVGALGNHAKVAQQASARNQSVTNQLARRALNIPEDVDLTRDTLEGIRKTAAQSYDAVASAGTITPGPQYAATIDQALRPFTSQAQSFPNRPLPPVVKDLEAFKTSSFDAGHAIDAIRVLRSDADAAYQAGRRVDGKAYRQVAGALEDAIDQHLALGGNSDMLNKYRDARETIAKTYTVEKALNDQTGNVNAHKLSAELAKGKPMNGDLETIAQVAHAFPKATQPLKEAAKQFSSTDVLAGSAAAGAAVAGHPAGAMVAAGAASGPAARNIALSGPVQRMALRDAQTAGTAEQGGLAPVLTNVFSRYGAPIQEYDKDALHETLAGIGAATSVSEVISAAAGGGGREVAPVIGQVRPDGTFAISGDIGTLRKQLTDAGIRQFVPMKGGVLVGRGDAAKAHGVFGHAE